LFQVGDVKQAIYGWRGGDTRLFHDIANLYNAHDERIKPRSLNVSWRSGWDIINMANQVFGNPDVFTELGFPQATIDRWLWEDHEVPEKNGQRKGYCALMHPVLPEGVSKAVHEDRFAVVVALLEKIQPVQRGISCSILVLTNKVGHDLVDYIRAHSNVPVMSDAEISIATDNAINRAAISYLKCIAHPGDTFAWNHLLMTPFGQVIRSRELTVGNVSATGMRMVFEHGFEFLVQYFFKELENVAETPFDAFSRSRSENLTLAARMFDERGSRDIDEFISYARLHKMREPDTNSAVQVMTVHQSKGLTFDMAILPELGRDAMTRVRSKIGVKQDENRDTEWILSLPVKDIAKADPAIRIYSEQSEADAAYESLCKLYVGLTRAKYANYIISDPPPKNPRSVNFQRFLYTTLAGEEFQEELIGKTPVEIAFESDSPETTDKNWFQQSPIIGPEETTTKTESSIGPLVSPDKARVRVARRTPSSSEGGIVTGDQIFSHQGKTARELGTLVHALFEEIEWYEPGILETLEKRCEETPGFSPETKTEAMGHISKSLTNPEIITALSRPASDAKCWREKPFEILLEKEWLSGTFDRVVIEKDKATILDFKTSFVDTDESFEETAKKYRAQLETYRQVLARMIGLSEDAIEMQLLFTRIPKIISL